MATYGGQDYTSFKAVNVRGSTSFRIEAGGAAATIKADLSEGLSRAYTFPNKSGTFGVSGTFTVNLPAVTAFSVYSTNVTVAGIRTEDALVCAIQNTGATINTTSWAARGFALLGGCQAGNGGVHLTFVNPADTATIYADLIMAYTAVR